MNNDYLDPINAEGMPKLVDAALALDLQLTAKMAVRNCAFSIAETASPEVRAVLHRHLTEALDLHGEITQLMMQKGWFHPYQLNEQFQLDMTSADTMVKIANMQLFQDDTSRRGLFATPNK